MKNNVIYEGFFISGLEGSLDKLVKNQHITTDFRPENPHPELYGEKAFFIVTGYGNDGENEGLSVELYGETKEHLKEQLRELYEKIPVPHITLSVSEEGKPVNTSRLVFSGEKFKGRVLSATFGAFNGQGVIYE